jgi:hypothetical protein
MNTTKILRNLIREEVKKALAGHSLNEAFASPILRKILIGIPGKNGYGSGYSKEIAQAFYNMSKVALDKVEDSEIQRMDPSLAYKTLKKNGGENLIVFYISEDGGENPYGKDSSAIQIKPGTLLGIASGDNQFYSMGWPKWNITSRKKGVTMATGDKGDNLGVSKTGSGYGSTGLYNVKRVSEVADVAYVIDLSNLKATKGTKEKIALRTSQKAGAVAFMSAKDFKNDNLKRYQQILRDKAANSPIDKIVLDTIGLVSDSIKQGVGNLTTGAYDSIIVGTSPKGREVKASDAANFLRQVLDDYERYIQYSKQAKQAASSGERSNYYSQEANQYALSLKQKANKAKTMDYAW